MPNKVINILPNITPACVVFLFHNYVCVEHYPYDDSSFVGRTLADVLSDLGLAFPAHCNYVFFRFKNHNVTIKEYGNDVCIIIKKRS